MEALPDSFLRDFLVPLVAGGELHVRRPLDAEDLVALEAELVTATEESLAIEMSRQAMAREMWLYPVATPLDRSDLALAAALHNLLFMSHPASERWWVRSSSLERMQQLTRLWLEQPSPPRTSAALVARHTLLCRLPALSRTDVEIRFWAGRRTFHGQEPPHRLLRWKGLRNVTATREQVVWLESDLSDVQRELVTMIFRQTPLTDLLSPMRPLPPFAWLPVAHLLQSRDVCRLVSHHYLELGLERVGPALARGFWQLVDSVEQHTVVPEAHRAAVRLVGSLVVHLYAVLAVTGNLKQEQLQVHPVDAVEALPAVLTTAARCGLLPDSSLLGDADLASHLREHAAVPAQQLGKTADDLTRRLEAALAA